MRATTARSGATSRAAALPSAQAAGSTARAGGPTLVPLAGYPAADPGNRLDVVILGDGYTAAQEGDFAADAKHLADGLFDISPYSDYLGYLNIVGVFAPSAQSGADHPPYDAGCSAETSHPISCCPDPGAPDSGSYADTRYDSSYCYYGVQRLLVPIDGGRVQADASAAYPDWDQILVVVNDPEYGGSGGGIAATSRDPAGAEVLKHELGHSLLQLDDEYTDYTPGYPPCSDIGRKGISDPCAANVTDASTLAKLKWKRWVTSGTPIPTSSPQSSGVTGLFLGAHYSPDTWYRPCDQCLMRYLERPFGSVAAEQLPIRLYTGGWQGPAGSPDGRIELIEPGSSLPEPGDVVLPAGEQQTFSVQVLGVAGTHTRVVWTVDGATAQEATLASGSTDSFAYTSDGATHTVRAEVTDIGGILHPTMVATSSSTRSWAVTPTPRVPVDLLDNGSFEQPLRTGWTSSHVPGSARRCGGDAADGSCVVRLSGSPRKARRLTAHLSGLSGSVAGDRLALSGWLDPANLRAAASVTATVRLADGSRRSLKLGAVPRDRRDHGGFLHRQAAMTLVDAVVSATVTVTLGKGRGAVRVDDLRLTTTPGG